MKCHLTGELVRLPLVHYEDRVEPFWELGISLDRVSIRGPLQKLDLCQETTISWDLDFVELDDTIVPQFYCLVFTKRTEKNLNYGGSTSRNLLDEQDNGVFSLAGRDRLRMFRHFKHWMCPATSLTSWNSNIFGHDSNFFYIHCEWFCGQISELEHFMSHNSGAKRILFPLSSFLFPHPQPSWYVFHSVTLCLSYSLHLYWLHV